MKTYDFLKIKDLIHNLDQKDRMQRKLQFLLDIRGYLIHNKLKGDYVEFGVYRGEMMYAAHAIMNKVLDFDRYIGLDTFSGEPDPTALDKEVNVFTQKGSFEGEYERVKGSLSKDISKLILIKGDFRADDVQKRFMDLKTKISVAVVDCNWSSSIEASLKLVLPHMLMGGVLFFDDMYISNFAGPYLIELLHKTVLNAGLSLEPFQVYPPFAKAFFIFPSQIRREKYHVQDKTNVTKT